MTEVGPTYSVVSLGPKKDKRKESVYIRLWHYNIGIFCFEGCGSSVIEKPGFNFRKHGKEAKRGCKVNVAPDGT